MNSRLLDQSREPALATADQGIFFRASDTALCDAYCGRMVNDGKNLRIVGANTAIADHYCSLIVRKLRALPNVRLQVHSASTTAGLLVNFNEILASLSTAEAIGGRNPSAPLRILIAGAADLISPEESRLLVRLITNFPGANTQVILLQAGSGGASPMDMPGSHVVQWEVNEPTHEEAEYMLARARAAGVQTEAIDLLHKVAPGLRVADPAPSPGRELEGEYAPMQAASAAGDVPAAFALDENKGRRHSMLFTGVICVVLVVVAFLIIAPIFPRQIIALRDSLIGPGPVAANAGAGTPRPPALFGAKPQGTASPDSPSQAAAVTPAANAQPAVGKDATLDQTRAAVVGEPAGDTTLSPNIASTHAAAGSEPGRAAKVAPEGAGVRAASAGRVAPETPPLLQLSQWASSKQQSTWGSILVPPHGEVPVSAAAPAVLDKNLKKSKETPSVTAVPGRSADTARPAQPAAPVNAPMEGAMAKVRAVPKNDVFVQHVALDTYEAARDWQLAHPGLTQALIVPVRPDTNSATKYAVLSGPFGTQASATEFARKEGVPPAFWLRSAASLKKAMPVNGQLTMREAR
jgi:hypothetical protein